MRIVTYPNPLDLNSNKELWDLIRYYPHFCATDTLKLGLETEYGRKEFGYLETIATLVDTMFEEFSNPIVDDIKLFLSVSKQIRKIDDDKQKASFRFNISDVVKSIKILSLSGVNASGFNSSEISKDQKILIDIYEKIKKEAIFDYLDKMNNISKDGLQYLIRKTILKSINYLLKGDATKKVAGIDSRVYSLEVGKECLAKIAEHIKTHKQQPQDFGKPSYFDFEEDQVEALLKAINNVETSIYEKVIVHGLHSFTPENIFVLKLLEKRGIEVIFLINYAENLPNIFRTWRQVYSWCDVSLEFARSLDLNTGSKLGQSIASVVEGLNVHNYTGDVTVYGNLTTFTDHEVRKAFEKVSKAKGNPLVKMETQFYAVKGTTSNELLKLYFPEQFSAKPFLSYPIGQFILGIYTMWDFDKKTVIINDSSINECAVSNVFKDEGYNLLQIFDAIKLYFSDIDTISQYYDRITVLRNAIIKIELSKKNDLKMISFFSVTMDEIDIFEKFLRFIETVSKKLFGNGETEIKFREHFSQLVSILKASNPASSTTQSLDFELVEDIEKRLQSDSTPISGDIQDVKDALNFFMKSNQDKDTSRWIVRDFEQIDGAVLMRKNKNTHQYHYALLSNKHMTKFDVDLVPWPISERMFLGYKEAESNFSIVAMSLIERKNFLKYMLFYGTFFYKGRIQLSYIKDEDDEEQELYYILKIIGLSEKKFKEEGRPSFIVENEREIEPEPNLGSLTKESKEIFSICPYKFFLTSIINEPIVYSSEYHIKYFVSNFIYIDIAKQRISQSQLPKVLDSAMDFYEKLFPFWKGATFADINKLIIKNFENTFRRSSQTSVSQDYDFRKKSFLLNKWEVNGENCMDFNRTNINVLLSDYFGSSDLYPNPQYLPHEKICENCNFSNICLRDYYVTK